MEHSDTEFVNCPLVRHHRVLRHRLANHLLKCRRSLSVVQQWRAHSAQWNTSSQGVATNNEQCGSAEQENWNHSENSEQWSTQAVEENNGQCADTEEEENWDDCDSPSYIPKTHYNFQKPPPLLSRNERKNWRLNRRRQNNI